MKSQYESVKLTYLGRVFIAFKGPVERLPTSAFKTNSKTILGIRQAASHSQKNVPIDALLRVEWFNSVNGGVKGAQNDFVLFELWSEYIFFSTVHSQGKH